MEAGLYSEIGRLLRDLHALIRQSISEDHRPHFTTPQIMVLSSLSKHGDMKITELSERLRLANSTISGIVDRLEKQNYVTRLKSQEDRRVVKVSLTEKFTRLHSEIHSVVEEKLEGKLAKADEEEIQIILKGLQTLKRLLEG